MEDDQRITGSGESISPLRLAALARRLFTMYINSIRYLGGGVGGPNRPGRVVGVAVLGDTGKFDTVVGANAGLGLHCAQAGRLAGAFPIGLGASI